jgi:hypothetical protein
MDVKNKNKIMISCCILSEEKLPHFLFLIENFLFKKKITFLLGF